MDPLMRMWHYESWFHEQEIQMEKLKALGILIGSFYNPEAANKMIKQEQPDFASSDEDWDETSRMIRKDALEDLQEGGRRRKRRRNKRKVIR
jgi:hypothetical protein